MQGPHPLRLTLFGCWRLQRGGRPLDVPSRSQRLVALLALHGRQARPHLAGVLWPEVPEERAQASLRAALSALRRCAPDLVEDGAGELQIAGDVVVDVAEFREQARRVLSDDVVEPVDPRAAAGGDLLPGWYDDWVVVERERIHQSRVRALEALARHFVERGRYAQALGAALTSVGIDPLRESAQRCLISVYLAEGNTADALRQYERFREVLRDELDVAPTHRMTSLIEQVTAKSLA